MLKPLKDFLVVSVIKTEDKTASGLLYKPATIEEKIVSGTVVAAGRGYLTDNGSIIPLEAKAGDTVLFNKQMAVEVKHNNKTFYLLREEHVLSAVE
jgi:chaperonin GroES